MQPAVHQNVSQHMTNAAHKEAVQAQIELRLAELRRLSYSEIERLPESHGNEVMIKGHKCSLTTFVQKLPPAELLVTVQLARPRLFGMMSMHTERGLVFGSHGAVREATSEELRNSGG